MSITPTPASGTLTQLNCNNTTPSSLNSNAFTAINVGAGDISNSVNPGIINLTFTSNSFTVTQLSAPLNNDLNLTINSNNINFQPPDITWTTRNIIINLSAGAFTFTLTGGDNLSITSGTISGLTLTGSNVYSGTSVATSSVQTATLTTNGFVNLVIVFNLAAGSSSGVCLLPDCDVLLSNNVVKNITEVEEKDEVQGYFSQKPQKIKKILKNIHNVDELDCTNVPFVIKKSAFGVNIPNKDIHISGHHRVILKDNECQNKFVGVQAFKLSECVKDEQSLKTVVYYHIILEDQKEALLVNDLPVESCQQDI
jgi:hypothetical protein